MDCTGTDLITELELVQRLNQHPEDICIGPLVTLTLTQARASLLLGVLAVFEDPPPLSFLPVGRLHPDVRLRLCGRHWLDLCYLCGVGACMVDSADLFTNTSWMLREACAGAGWDAKEISNLFAWRRVQLT